LKKQFQVKNVQSKVNDTVVIEKENIAVNSNAKNKESDAIAIEKEITPIGKDEDEKTNDMINDQPTSTKKWKVAKRIKSAVPQENNSDVATPGGDMETPGGDMETPGGDIADMEEFPGQTEAEKFYQLNPGEIGKEKEREEQQVPGKSSIIQINVKQDVM